MTALVKICGIRTRPALDTAITGGADFVGFVFYPRSPRSLTPLEAKELADRARAQSSVRSVALVVDADDRLIDDIVSAVVPDLLQLHGYETPQRVAEVRARTHIAVMKAISVATADDVKKAEAYLAVADRILFDAKAPKGLKGALPGGNGLSFDWQLLAGVADKIPFMLSGGLNPDNVEAAIQLTGAWAVDVSSGVESRPGEKDLGLITRFLQAARSANKASSTAT